jgi:ribosomal protein S18 acetylase RimI-like enzyme
MVAWALRKSESDKIRPFRIHHDLPALASLLEIAFGDELALTESHMIEEMRQLAAIAPLLRVTSPLNRFLTGYVWVEHGELVGSVSLSEKEGATWMVTNVAVLPEYRGRGIAGRLMDVAIEHVRRRGGRRMWLQVRRDNAVASALYLHSGFVTYDTVHECKLPRHASPTVVGPAPAALRPIRARDARQVYRVVLANTPRRALAHQPVRLSDFRRGLGWRIARFFGLAFGGSEILELVGSQNGEIVAYGRLSGHLGNTPNEVRLYVMAGERGRWEEALLTGLWRLSAGWPRRGCLAYASETHPEALAALQRMGFRTLRVLNQMSLEL